MGVTVRSVLEDIATPQDTAASAGDGSAPFVEGLAGLDPALQRALLRAQTEALLDGILVVSTEGRILVANPRFVEMWEIPDEVIRSGSDEAALASVQDKLRDPDEFLERVAYLYRHPEERSHDEIALLDGRTFERYSAPVRLDDGSYGGRVWFFRDVTDRVRQERAQKFLVEASTALASSLDYETTLASVARLAVPALADWCVVDLVTDDGAIRRVAVVCADPARRELAAELQASYPPQPSAAEGTAKVLRGGAPELIERVSPEWIDAMAPDAKQRQILRGLGLCSNLLVPLVARGRTVGVLTLATAESGRVYGPADLALAEELARRAAIAVDNARLYREAAERAQAAEALAFVGDGILLVDRDSVVRLWNAAAETITGLRAEGVMGRPAADAIPGWAALESHVVLAATPGEAAPGEVLVLQLGDREVWLSVVGVRFHAGTVFAFRDLTAERAVEKLKSDFVSTVSHELRTPLAGVYGAAMTLQREDVRFDDQQRRVLLDVIAAEAGRLGRIVEDILSVGQLEAHALTLRVEANDATAIAGEAVRAARMRLTTDLPIEIASTTDAMVAADRTRLLQVLGNLLDNAIKYSPDGSLVELHVDAADARIRFSVSDRGLGIPAGERERIFAKFFRLDPELARGVGGTGLGLYICRELVGVMGGRIWADARTGGGSTFVVELPAA
jgi:PAS domain S-box-containing protein